MTSDPLPPLREVIAACNLSAKKSLGQNFLLDLNITRKIARAVPMLADAHVIEIGPGPGGLTRGLLMEGAAKVTAIELDDRTGPALEAIKAAYPGRFNYLLGDALKVDEKTLIDGSHPAHIAANLPYNIASVLLVKWLQAETWPPFWGSLTVMLQKEMALRLVAPPGNKTYGRLSVLAQWRTSPNILFHIPPDAFTPKPKVTSTVIQITPADPVVQELTGQGVSAFTQTLFGQRRKTLRNVLKKLNPDVEDILKSEGIDPGLRPENLTVTEICQLAKRFSSKAL